MGLPVFTSFLSPNTLISDEKINTVLSTIIAENEQLMTTLFYQTFLYVAHYNGVFFKQTKVTICCKITSNFT